MFGSFVRLSLYLSALTTVYAATKEDWKTRSIYQVIVDRYALPAGADTTKCNPGDQTWCGGTWNTVRDNLDYIQNAGFNAIWISPVSENYEGPRSAYGDAYHGYWIADASKLNDRFGTADDLKALSDEVHKRGMYLMVDVVVNNVMSTSLTPDLSTYMFKDQSQYHPYCEIQWGNHTSEQNCWLGDDKVPLPDVNTQDPTVVSGYVQWIKSLVQTYNIDGLRIDAAKHVDAEFWPQFCGPNGADVFCIGEVFDADTPYASTWQGPLDSILHYPMYNALVQAFSLPGPQNMSAMVDMIGQAKQMFKDPSVLGNFLENQDLPRWHNLSVDPQSLWNAMVYNFMSDGIPIMYYGQEQGFSGNADPWNREPLWTSGYANTTTYQLVTQLNAFRSFLYKNSPAWLNSSMEILASTNSALAFQKGPVITVVTNVGSPPANEHIAINTPYSPSFVTVDILTCQQFVVGSNGIIEVEYSKGGMAHILAPRDLLENSSICSHTTVAVQETQAQLASSALSDLTKPLSSLGIFILFVLGLLNSGIGL